MQLTLMAGKITYLCFLLTVGCFESLLLDLLQLPFLHSTSLTFFAVPKAPMSYLSHFIRFSFLPCPLLNTESLFSLSTIHFHKRSPVVQYTLWVAAHFSGAFMDTTSNFLQ